ncbi:hypothetical protein THF1C08_1190001 [Vibrio jasicida]|nr:hypothetical protein THF1C08_1190001 [Vibrio jasicida]
MISSPSVIAQKSLLLSLDSFWATRMTVRGDTLASFAVS